MGGDALRALSFADWSMLAYLSMLVAMALYQVRTVKARDDLFLAGRSMSRWPVAIVPDDALPVFILQVFPAGARGLALAGIMAALLTSLQGGLAALAACVQVD